MRHGTGCDFITNQAENMGCNHTELVELVMIRVIPGMVVLFVKRSEN